MRDLVVVASDEELLAELVKRGVLNCEFEVHYKYDWSKGPHESVDSSEPVPVNRWVTDWKRS